MTRYKGIRDPLHFLGFDCFSYGLNKRSYMQELNANLFFSYYHLSRILIDLNSVGSDCNWL